MLTYLILTIVVMSCFIAYLGDYLGRRLGKRRLTLFGMRPKHTAILITVVTGMLIASATLGAMMIVSRDVRRALLQYHQIQDDLQQAQRDRDDAHLQVSQFRGEADRDQIALKDLHQQETNAEAQLKTAQQKLQEGTQALDEIRARKDQLETANGSLRDANGGLLQDQKQKRREIEDLSRSEQEAIRTVDRLRRARDEAQARVQTLASLKGELEDRNGRLRGENTQLAANNTDLKARNDNLRLTFTKLKERNNTLLAKNGSLEDANKRLVAENGKLSAHNALLVAYGNNFYSKWLSSIRNKVMFEPDQLIAQGVVDCDHPSDEIRQAIRDLVSKAQDAAKDAGAVDSDGDGMALRLLDRDMDLSHDEVVQKFTNRLIGEHGQVVVRIQARGRFAVGDEVIAGIEAVPDRKIYQRGQTIAVAQLDGQESEKSIRNEVAAFLATKVRPTALDAGLLPDANNQISTDVLDKILDLSHEVHEKGRPVQVTAIAADDTWCYEPLDLTFKVE